MFTAANYEHVPIMNSPDRRTDFQRRLLFAFREIEAIIVAWVILANHYHIIACVNSLEDVSAALKQLHGSTSFEWNLADGLQGKRKVWYKFSDRMIRGNEHYFRALNYIHYNPIKHGYVGRPAIGNGQVCRCITKIMDRNGCVKNGKIFLPKRNMVKGGMRCNSQTTKVVTTWVS